MRTRTTELMFKARESQRIFKGNKIFNFIFHLVHLEHILRKIQEFFNPMSVTQKIIINILMNVCKMLNYL